MIFTMNLLVKLVNLLCKVLLIECDIILHADQHINFNDTCSQNDRKIQMIFRM